MKKTLCTLLVFYLGVNYRWIKPLIGKFLIQDRGLGNQIFGNLKSKSFSVKDNSLITWSYPIQYFYKLPTALL